MTKLDVTRRLAGDDGLPGPLASPRGAFGGAVLGGGHLPPKNLLLILWRGGWIVLLCCGLALGGGFYYLSKQTPVYASSSRVLVEADGPVIISSEGSGRSQSVNYLATQCELIKSAQILSPVADLPELRGMKTFGEADNPLPVLRSGLTADVGQRDDLITVTFESPYPAEAASVVNAVVDSYKAYHANRKRSNAAEVLRIFTNEKRDAEKQLADVTRRMLEFKQKNPDLSYTGEKGNIIIDQLGKLSDALTSARLDALQAKGAYESARAIGADPVRMEQWLRIQQASAGGANAALLGEILRIEVELSSLKQNLLPEHASVKAMEGRVDELRRRLADDAKQSFDAYLAVLQQRTAEAQQREAELRDTFAQQQKQALALSTESAEYAVMEAEARRLERHCDVLDGRIKETKITEDAGPMNISVLEAGRPGLSPVKPKRATVLFESLLIGLLAGCGLAYLRDTADHRLASADEIHARLGLTVLGVLPHMNGRETAAVRGQKVQLDPMSDVAEAYRTIRTAVYFGAPDGRTRTILVTSPAPGDGKTTSASNLAIAMAQAGQRVLLLDCDFRKPTQHRVFGVEDGTGLSTVLAGHTPLSKAVKTTPTRGLFLLPAGPVPANPSEILNGHAFAQLLGKLREKFDHIVIDSPPVLPVTDARILGASADLTVLVLRAQKSTRRVSAHACESLLSVGSRVLGVIVNDAPRGRNGYLGYGYGPSRYGYGSGNGKSGVPLEGPTNGARLPVPAGADGEN